MPVRTLADAFIFHISTFSPIRISPFHIPHFYIYAMRHILLLFITLFSLVATAQTPQNSAASTTTTAAPAKQVEATTQSQATPAGEGQQVAPVQRTYSPSRVPSVYPGLRQRYKTRGYRVQVYSGMGNTAAKEAANKMAAVVRKSFPELSVYCHFKTPRWVCRVGDFSTKIAAEKYLTKIQRAKISSEASVVIDDVLLPRP